MILLLGEIGGTTEEEAAEFIAQNVTKPVVALIVAGLPLRANLWGMPGR